MLHEWVEVVRLEMEATVRAAGNTVAPLAGASGTTVSAYVRTIKAVEGNKGGRALGSGARRLGSFMADLPLVTWQMDLVKARYHLDELAGAVREADLNTCAGSLAAVRLADALEQIRRDRLALRGISAVTNPIGTSLAIALRSAASIGAGEPLQRRLLRRAHHSAAVRLKAGRGTHEDLFVVARTYLIGGKPNAALHYAVLAGQRASRARAALTAPAPVTDQSLWKRIKSEGMLNGLGDYLLDVVDRADNKLDDLLEPTYDQLPERERYLRQEGAALVIAGFASLQAGQVEMAETLGRSAADRGNTMGYLVRAACLPPGNPRLRADLIKMIDRRDRQYYQGAAHGDIWMLASAAEMQGQRMARFGKRLEDAWKNW